MSFNISQKRILRDYREIQQDPNLSYFSVHPLEDNLLEWHVNFKPNEGIYQGIIFHVILLFNSDPEQPFYPHSPPKIKLCNKIYHPNVFWHDSNNYPYICLDLLKNRNYYTPRYSGWSTAYTLGSILMQLSTFFFETKIEQEGGYTLENQVSPQQVEECRQSSLNFVCHQCGHSHRSPVPAINPVENTSQGSFQGTLLENKRTNTSLADNPDVIRHILQFLPPSTIKVCQWVEKSWMTALTQIDNRRQIVCFHSKLPLGSNLMGIGINVVYHKKNNTLRTISSQFDYLSHQAYQNGVRGSTWNHTITHFLPLVINKSNIKQGFPIVIKTIGEIMKTNIVGSVDILNFFATFMNSIVVELFKVGRKGQINRYASEKAMVGYTCLHHLLLYLLSKYPKIRTEANKKLELFLSDESHRRKKKVPDLGRFLVYLAVSSPEYNWTNFKYIYLKETFIRNVRWMIKDNPILGDLSLEMNQRLSLTFSNPSFATSRSLIMFQIYFLNYIARPKGKTQRQILTEYNYNYGRPSTQAMENLQLRSKQILAVKDWMEYFNLLEVNIPPKEKFFEIWLDSVNKSKEYGYHRDLLKRNRRY